MQVFKILKKICHNGKTKMTLKTYRTHKCFKFFRSRIIEQYEKNVRDAI